MLINFKKKFFPFFLTLFIFVTILFWKFSPENILSKYEKQKIFGQVRTTLEDNLQALEKNPKNDSAYDSLGQGFFGLRGYDDAIWAFTEATKLKPESDSYWFFLGKAYQAKKDYKKAKEAYIKTLEINPNNPLYYTTLAWLYYFRLDAEMNKAYEILKKGLGKFPTDKDILFDITRFYLYDKNEKEFRKYAPRYLKIDPNQDLIKNAYEKGIQ